MLTQPDEPQIKFRTNASAAEERATLSKTARNVRSMNWEELDVWMEQMSTWMDEINLLASSEEEKSPEIAEQDFPTGGR